MHAFSRGGKSIKDRTYKSWYGLCSRHARPSQAGCKLMSAMAMFLCPGGGSRTLGSSGAGTGTARFRRAVRKVETRLAV